MNESCPDQSQWWKVEPPDYDFEPPEQDGVFEDVDRLESIDQLNIATYDRRNNLEGTGSNRLFANVRVIEENGSLRFNVPRRFVDTPEDGKWSLEVSGGRRWFKERDDFGVVRFLKNGNSIWVPHLFPFEDTDDQGLPIILDRERCEVTVSLQPPIGLYVDKPLNVTIETREGKFSAGESPDSYNVAGISYFTEYTWDGKPLVSDLVTYPERRWPSLQIYLQEMKPNVSADEYDAIMCGEPSADEGIAPYLAQYQPGDWFDRESSGYGGTAFGTIWVPVEMLRDNRIVADISFPCFSESVAEL
jgi:hypothetical protein